LSSPRRSTPRVSAATRCTQQQRDRSHAYLRRRAGSSTRVTATSALADAVPEGELMAITCELAQRTAVRAFRVGQRALVVAEGELPDPSYEAKITQRPQRIFPPWYQVLSCPRVGVFPDVIASLPRIAHRRVPRGTIDDHGLPRRRRGRRDDRGVWRRAVGVQRDRRRCSPRRGSSRRGRRCDGVRKEAELRRASADALTRLPPIEPDDPVTLETVRVVEVGGLFGGIAGFHDLYVKVSRAHDYAVPLCCALCPRRYSER
jgi:hypothetical protein